MFHDSQLLIQCCVSHTTKVSVAVFFGKLKITCKLLRKVTPKEDFALRKNAHIQKSRETITLTSTEFFLWEANSARTPGEAVI